MDREAERGRKKKGTEQRVDGSGRARGIVFRRWRLLSSSNGEWTMRTETPVHGGEHVGTSGDCYILPIAQRASGAPRSPWPRPAGLDAAIGRAWVQKQSSWLWLESPTRHCIGRPRGRSEAPLERSRTVAVGPGAGVCECLLQTLRRDGLGGACGLCPMGARWTPVEAAIGR